MIPSHWFRRIVLIIFLMEVGGGILWVSGSLTTNAAVKPLIETLGSLIFLFGFYATAPLAAKFLAPHPSQNIVLQARLRGVMASFHDSRPVFLYDHTDQEANTVGLLPAHSRIYITTGLLENMSDEGVRGVIAHENAHVQERHIMGMFAYASCFTVGSHLLNDNRFFFAAFLVFLGLRRYCEFRADAAAAAEVGPSVMLTALRELSILYPSKSWVRWLTFASAYPTLAMRIKAIETGRKILL